MLLFDSLAAFINVSIEVEKKPWLGLWRCMILCTSISVFIALIWAFLMNQTNQVHRVLHFFFINSAFSIFFFYLGLLVLFVSRHLCFFTFWRRDLLFSKNEVNILLRGKTFHNVSLALGLAILTFSFIMAWYIVRFDGSDTSISNWIRWLG